MSTVAHSGFSFSRVVIIQSLRGDDPPTGESLAQSIPHILHEYQPLIPVELIDCVSGGHFLRIIDQLCVEARTGLVPLLHVECHGDPQSGLEFADYSDLSWPELSAAMVQLNLASRFNLMAIFSACYGWHFVNEMNIIHRSPCWCLVAPTSKIRPYEILGGLRDFYQVFFTTRNISEAFETLACRDLENGIWLNPIAEAWFERLLIGYVEEHCSLAAGDKRISGHYRSLKSEGKRVSKGRLKRLFIQVQQRNLLNRYFDHYFMADLLPQNRERFKGVHARIRSRLADLRATNKYYI
nr:hypothetical protein [uncultured Pseudomonas sp.]